MNGGQSLNRCSLAAVLTAVAISGVSAADVAAQQGAPMTGGSDQLPHVFAPGAERSSNMKLIAHIPLGPRNSVSDIEVEHELSRPYAYVSRRLPEAGFDLITLKDPKGAKLIYSWRIENKELHQGSGGMRGVYFKLKGRYYYAQSTQFRQGGPNTEVGAVVFDVTSLPDVSKIREVGRMKAPDAPGGFHNIYAYKHSDGRVLMFATSGPGSKVYDMEKFLAGATDQGLIGFVPVPANPGDLSKGYHDFYVGFDVATQQDKFYGAGGGGYYVFDVTNPSEPALLSTIVGVNGFNWGHTFTPTPDGKYAVGEAEWQYQPLRIFDLKPDGKTELRNINRPIGAWQANWQTVAHNHEVRWPYVFVSGYETGLSVFNMMDPTNPYTVGYYDTYNGQHNEGGMAQQRAGGGGGNFTWGVYDGVWGVDVRNADGIVVASDMTSGFWAFKMEGFDGWNGHDWGMPNISSAQDWDNGPDGVRKKPVT